jgi:hypothetical protein
MPDEIVKDKLNTATLFYFIYLMYKCNLVTRRNVADMLKMIKKDAPSDITKYLVEESARSVS